MTRNPLRRRIRAAAWLSSLGGGFATVALIAGVAHTAAHASTTASDPSTTATSSTSGASSAHSNSSSSSDSQLEVPAQNQPAAGGSNGS